MKKHSVTISGHQTSISLEDEFWFGLKALAKARKVTLAELVRDIDKDRGERNLSSALRIAILAYYQQGNPLD